MTLDYYRVLAVGVDSTTKEIRASFKRLMLEAHPDKNPHRLDWSERRVRELIEAFDVLGTDKARADFDLRRAAASAATTRRKANLKRADEPFFFRKTDPESRALLLLHHLTHKRPKAAVEVLDQMELRYGPSFLRDHLDRADYLDCLFLLAEYQTSKRQYLRAAGHLKELYSHERFSRFPRHYLSEVVRLLKDLYLRKIPGTSEKQAALAALEDAGAFDLTRAEESLRLRKIAQIRLDQGELAAAKRALDQAELLFPLSKDLEQIRRKIHVAR